MTCYLGSILMIVTTSDMDTVDWYKVSQDWKKTAELLAINIGNVKSAQEIYQDIADGLYDRVREKMAIEKNTQNTFDSIHDYVNVISQKTLMAEAQRSLAEADGTSDYYYWEGYVDALDYAIDLVPNYNDSPETESPAVKAAYDLEEDWWQAIK